MRLEPIVEITQYKGDSEAHPDLSPIDEFADFGLFPWYIQRIRSNNYQARPGDYVRSALKTGLELEAELTVNPYAFGVIGSTDSHTGLATAEEANFWGKMASGATPERKSRQRSQSAVSQIGPTGWSMQAAGLAAVWAEANTKARAIRRNSFGVGRTKCRIFSYSGTRVLEPNLVQTAVAGRDQLDSIERNINSASNAAAL